MGGIGRRITVQTGLGKSPRPYLENNASKRVGSMTQMADHPCSMSKALSSNSSTAKIKLKYILN
jgi:hypothetical protein